MSEDAASPGPAQTNKAQKTGLELSSNARRDFIVNLAQQLRNLEGPIEILGRAAQLLGEFLLAERAGAYCITDGQIVHQACWTAGWLPAFAGIRPISTLGPKIIETYRERRTAMTIDVVAEGMRVPMTYSAVGVPLFRKGRWEGTFFIHRDAGQPWRQDEIFLTEEVAQLSWDAHERALAGEALKIREAELSRAMRAAALVPFDYDLIGQAMKPSAELNRLYGYPPDHPLTLADIRARYHPDVPASFLEEMAAQIQDPTVKEYELHLHLLLPGGEVRWLYGRGEYLRDVNGAAYRSLGVVTDVTERKKLEDTQRHLVHELDHRIKNILATVTAICAQTLRNSDNLLEAKATLLERIRALASTNDLLVKTNWRSAKIQDVIERSTAVYPDMAKRISFRGPECILSARQALMFSLALHELVTNAFKYGALANEQGRVSATWNVGGTRENHLVFEWREVGGPPVTMPLRVGFGTRTLSAVLPGEFNGRSQLDYAREGFCFRMEGDLG